MGFNDDENFTIKSTISALGEASKLKFSAMNPILLSEQFKNFHLNAVENNPKFCRDFYRAHLEGCEEIIKERQQEEKEKRAKEKEERELAQKSLVTTTSPTNDSSTSLKRKAPYAQDGSWKIPKTTTDHHAPKQAAPKANEPAMDDDDSDYEHVSPVQSTRSSPVADIASTPAASPSPPPSYNSLVLAQVQSVKCLPERIASSNKALVHCPDTMDTSGGESDHKNVETDLLLGDTKTFGELRNSYFCKPQSPIITSNIVRDPVFNIMKRLSLQRKGKELGTYLLDRPEAEIRETLGAPKTWEMNAPGLVVAAVEMLKGKGHHVGLHKTFAQMRLYELVTAKCNTAIVDAVNRGNHGENHLIIIDDLAHKENRGRPAKFIINRKNEMIRAYRAGKRWKDTCDAFGGSGTPLVFITAGIAPYKIAHDFDLENLGLLQHLAQHLPTIKNVISDLGKDALECYCMSGNLKSEIRDTLDYDDDA